MSNQKDVKAKQLPLCKKLLNLFNKLVFPWEQKYDLIFFKLVYNYSKNVMVELQRPLYYFFGYWNKL